jgi:hypothetical protein
LVLSALYDSDIGIKKSAVKLLVESSDWDKRMTPILVEMAKDNSPEGQTYQV